MLVDGIIALLKADTTVSEAVGERVYETVLPRGYELPALVVHRYGPGVQDYDYSGPVDVREDQVQVDVYGKAAVQALAKAVRDLLAAFVGTLPDADGTKVQACYVIRDMDMDFLPNADTKGIAYRTVLGFRVVSLRG